ncbi:MAG: DUF4363 family protein [Ruminococcus sp.]|nr:DUF4363 family protein [Ruminococcus sp.]MDE6848999.1 DUF4363 family protein [Ruminococcus sp.]MDE7137523.1 DUF4363 family protein [Ruminococcus sp.]
MMRIKISTGILCLLVGVSIFFSIWINNRCSYMLDEISEIYELLDSGDTDKAVSSAKKLDDNWNSFRKKATIMIKNDELTDIDCISSGIPYLIENDSDEAHSRLIELRHMLEMLKGGEIPTLTRIL